MSKNKKIILTASQIQALPVSVSEARKILGNGVSNISDDEVALQVLALNELAIILYKNIDLHKLHL